MKKAQQSIPLVLLGIVAIIALIGLVLLFSRQNSITQLGIGDVYGPGRGIAQQQPLPPYQPGAPIVEFPAYQTSVQTIGTRTPIMIFFRGEYSNIGDMSKCWADIQPHMAAPQDAFSCYVVPTSLPAYEVTGFFWPTSSALPRPLYDLGGDIYCYERSPYDREEMFTRLSGILLEKGWKVDKANDQDVLMCTKGATYIFPQ